LICSHLCEYLKTHIVPPRHKGCLGRPDYRLSNLHNSNYFNMSGLNLYFGRLFKATNEILLPAFPWKSVSIRLIHLSAYIFLPYFLDHFNFIPRSLCVQNFVCTSFASWGIRMLWFSFIHSYIV
jgi:hypothetical protein